MSAVNKIGVVVGVGAIISVGYYFLNKSKPKVSEDQLAQLNASTVTPYEEQLVPVRTIEEQLKIDKCTGLPRSEYMTCMGIIPEETRRNTETPSSVTPASSATTQPPIVRSVDTSINTYTSPRAVSTSTRTGSTSTRTDSVSTGTTYSSGRRV